MDDARLLGDVGDPAVPIGAVELGDGVPVDQVTAAIGLAQLQEDLNQGRLAGPRGADDPDRFPGRDLEVDPGEHRPLRQVGVGDVFEAKRLDSVEAAAEGDGGAGAVGAFGLLQAFDKGERLLDLLVGGLQLLAIGAGPDQQEDHRSQRGHLADVAQIKRGKAYDDD